MGPAEEFEDEEDGEDEEERKEGEEKSNVPSRRWHTRTPSGSSSRRSVSAKPRSALETVASGAWKGGCSAGTIAGVRSSTRGGDERVGEEDVVEEFVEEVVVWG